MGQYFIPVNLTKREYIHAHAFGDGLKMGEWTYPQSDTMKALRTLKATRWAGDNVIDFVGDYEHEALYHEARENFTDVSEIAKELVRGVPEVGHECVSTRTSDGNGAYCNVCGETLE